MNMLMKYAFLGMICGSMLMPSYAKAEETVTTDSVVVSATRVERELMDVPMSVSVVTQEDIKRNPSTSIAELLRDIPGLEVQENSPGLKRIAIRGEDAFRTLVLIDGQKVSEQKSMSGTAILVDPANIERIEVIKGPASVLYGSDAIGGVINIITKKSATKPLQGSASLGYYSATEGFSQSLNLFGAKNGWNYSLAASNSNHGDTDTPYGELPNSEYDQQDFRGSLSYDFTENLTAGISASYFHSKNYTASYKVVDKKIEDEMTATMTTDPWDMTKIGAFVEAKDINDYLARVRFDAWYQQTDKTFVNTMDPMPMYSFFAHTENTLDTIGASIQTDWLLGENHYLIAGYDFYRDSLDADDYKTYKGMSMVAGRPPSFVPANASERAVSESSQTNHALYLAMESTLPADFILSYGVRYTYVDTELDSFKNEGTRMSPMGTPYDATKYDSGSTSNSRPVFNVGLVWEGIDNLALRASWAQGFRVPFLTEKYVDSGMMGMVLQANPNLDPETSDNFEIGARYNNNGLSVDVAAFYSLANDYIDTVEVTPDVLAVYQNVAEAKTFGLEASLRYDFDNGISPYIYATMMRREFNYGTFKTYDTGTPLLSGRLGLMYNKNGMFDDMLNFNANLYVSGQTDATSQTSATAAKEDYDDFATLNLGFGADFGKEKDWNVQVELLNIFDKTYFVNAAGIGNDIPETGFNANVRLTYTF